MIKTEQKNETRKVDIFANNIKVLNSEIKAYIYTGDRVGCCSRMSCWCNRECKIIKNCLAISGLKSIFNFKTNICAISGVNFFIVTLCSK